MTSPWINRHDRTPEDGQHIIMISVAAGPKQDYVSDCYCGYYQANCDVWVRWPLPTRPTHWMPRPPDPAAD